jgi:TRAP-type uncharacterized transport system fused permease subunit
MDGILHKGVVGIKPYFAAVLCPALAAATCYFSLKDVANGNVENVPYAAGLLLFLALVLGLINFNNVKYFEIAYDGLRQHKVFFGSSFLSFYTVLEVNAKEHEIRTLKRVLKIYTAEDGFWADLDEKYRTFCEREREYFSAMRDKHRGIVTLNETIYRPKFNFLVAIVSLLLSLFNWQIVHPQHRFWSSLLLIFVPSTLDLLIKQHRHKDEVTELKTARREFESMVKGAMHGS